MRSSLIAALAVVVVSQGIPTLGICQPSPPNSTLPAFIQLVGMNNGTPDPRGTFTVVVRDVANNPMQGETVTVDFTGCPQLAAAVPNCSGIVSAVTNALGVAQFLVMGSVVARSAAEPVGGCALISAGSTPLGTVFVTAYDQDGVNGVRANDVTLWTCDFLDGLYRQRSDFDGSGSIGAVDLSILLSVYAAGTSDVTAARCDGVPAQNVVLAPVGGLGLRWSDCPGGGGAVTRPFACTVNTGTDELVASLVAPEGVTELMSFEAEFLVIGEEGLPLADWWRLQAGGCRSGLQIASATGAGTCPAVGLNGLSAQVVYPYPKGVNYEGIRVVGAFDGASVPLDPGTDYELFRLRINHTRTVGAGACAGCSAPVAVILRSVRFAQGSCSDAGVIPDLIVTEPGPSVTNIAYWQGVPPGVNVDVPVSSPGLAWLAPPGPNPGRGPFTLGFTLPRAGEGSLDLYDVAGRKVRGLSRGWMEAGSHVMTWDGRDERGVEASAGVYVVRLATENVSLTRILVRLK